MAPWIPRLHLFEIDDQPWFPSFLRAHVQTGLTHAWTTRIPVLQSCSPATLVAKTLRQQLGRSASGYTYIDFCAGAGGPTPSIARALNSQLAAGTSASSEGPAAPSYAAVASRTPFAHFVLTDLHPHIQSWEKAVKRSTYMSYIPEPVDAAAVPQNLIERFQAQGKPVFRLFNLAFHHFDDHLARAILKNTIETSAGFGYVSPVPYDLSPPSTVFQIQMPVSMSPFVRLKIMPMLTPFLLSIFELQSRSISSFISCFLFGCFVFLLAPFLYWWSPQILFFVYIVPVIPFVIVFDGLVSSLRTRTPEEIEILLRTCGAGDTSDWVVSSGSQTVLWPVGQLTWVVGTKQTRGRETMQS
ncbi:hypothetical protein F5Y16DRAFT_421737 [Xylariaceae sp. FL0255]|nr:hypothetical protein F5Y16DRAFT_421737 [Xylariaceae sp. FL0255]